MERRAFTVKGMTCDNCVNTVTEALKQVAGVKVVKVSLAEEKAQVTFDPTDTSIDQLKRAIEDVGYEVAS